MENTLSGDISSNEVVVYSIVYMVYIYNRAFARKRARGTTNDRGSGKLSGGN